jgi:undecaprenyl diphosphate synthase
MNPIKHVAIIMDGNGRWGIKNKKSRNMGHKAGLTSVEKIIKKTLQKKIKFLTLYAFSSENWKRPKREVQFLFNLLEEFLITKTNQLNKQDIKFTVIGSRKNFSKKLVTILSNSEESTKKNKSLQINLALNYGFRSELINAISIMRKNNILFNESNITKHLYTKNVPDPDLLIRTGNTNRLSNFLLWQLAYSEIYFVKKLWPDFSTKDYNKILNNFKNLKRNFGGI